MTGPIALVIIIAMNVEQGQVKLERLELAAQQIWQVITRPETVLRVVRHCPQMDWPPFKEPGLGGRLTDLRKGIDKARRRGKIDSEPERRELFTALPKEGIRRLFDGQSLPETVYVEIGPDGRSFAIKGVIVLRAVLEKNALIGDTLDDFREALPGWEWGEADRGKNGFVITGRRILNEDSFVTSYASYLEVPHIQNRLREMRINT